MNSTARADGRRRLHRHLSMIALTGVMTIGSVAAQEPAIRLTLADALAKGLATSHRLGELEARREASDAQIQGVRANALPQVVASGGYTRTNHVTEFGITMPTGATRVIYPDVPDNVRSRVDVQWPIYTGGRIDALIEAARADAAAAAGDIDAARTDLRLEIARAYWTLVTARESVTVVQASLERVEAHLRDARARFDAGFVPPNEVSSAEAQRSLQQALLIESRNAVRQATIALARLIGAPPTSVIEPVEPLGPPAASSADAESLVALARASRGDRRALATRIDAATSRRLAAGAAARPTVVAVAGADLARPNPRIFPRAADWNDSWDVSLNVSWSIFDGGRVKADVASADALTRALRQRLDEFDSVLDAEIRQRGYDVESSLARATAAADAVRSATDARRVLQDRYQAGVATSTDVLDAQVVLLDAELQRTRALAAARIAEAGLARAIGREP